MLVDEQKENRNKNICNNTKGLYFLKCTNEKMYSDYDLEDAENFSSITDFYVANQMMVVMKQICIPKNKKYLLHLCLYKNLIELAEKAKEGEQKNEKIG